MKALFFLVAIAIVGLVVTGAIHFQKTSDNSMTIQVDREKLAEDAEAVIDKGQELLEEAEAALHRNSGRN